MKGGTSIDVLLDLALGDDEAIAGQAAEVLKTQVFLYEADMDRLKLAYDSGSAIAKGILESYARAEFFTKIPDIEELLKSLLILQARDISTDLLSPGNQAHSRSDREATHGKC